MANGNYGWSDNLKTERKKMINWTKMIDKNRLSVLNFAVGLKTSTDFQKDFSGIPHTASFAVKNNGAIYARRLARKALRRRGLLV